MYKFYIFFCHTLNNMSALIFLFYIDSIKIVVLEGFTLIFMIFILKTPDSAILGSLTTNCMQDYVFFFFLGNILAISCFA